MISRWTRSCHNSCANTGRSFLPPPCRGPFPPSHAFISNRPWEVGQKPSHLTAPASSRICISPIRFSTPEILELGLRLLWALNLKRDVLVGWGGLATEAEKNKWLVEMKSHLTFERERNNFRAFFFTLEVPGPAPQACVSFCPEFLMHPDHPNIVTCIHTHTFPKLNQLADFCNMDPKITENKNQNYYYKYINTANISVESTCHTQNTTIPVLPIQSIKMLRTKIRPPVI